MFRSTCLGLSMVVSLVVGWSTGTYGQSLPHHHIADDLAQLDRAICLGQWQQAIDITSGLMASSEVSADYRQTLLGFRRQLQVWQTSALPPQSPSSCDRTQALFITLDEPTAPEPQPLDWNRALATLANRRPIIDLNDDVEPTTDLIPSELTSSSPGLLTDWATPIDTTNGFNVIGGRINGDQKVYSFLGRLGDRVSLELDVTRTYMGGDSQLFVFDQDGRFLTQSDPDNLQASIQDFALPQTNVYFAVISPQGAPPSLDARGLITNWQITDGASFDYTLTLTGVTPYQTLLPQTLLP